jgi:hypothetical protein
MRNGQNVGRLHPVQMGVLTFLPSPGLAGRVRPAQRFMELLHRLGAPVKPSIRSIFLAHRDAAKLFSVLGFLLVARRRA